MEVKSTNFHDRDQTESWVIVLEVSSRLGFLASRLYMGSSTILEGQVDLKGYFV